jgi:hypothetical protein
LKIVELTEEEMIQEITALKERERLIQEVEVEVQEILRINNLADSQDQDHKASISNKKVSKTLK